MHTTIPRKPPFTLSAESERLITLLESVAVGAKVSYATLIEAAGGEPADGIYPIYPALKTARKYCQREHNMVFSVISGVGLVRLSDAEIIPESRHKLAAVRRKVQRVRETLACADFEKLTPAQRNEALSLQAQTGAIKLMSSIKAGNQLQHRIAAAGAPLQIGNVMRLFRAPKA